MADRKITALTELTAPVATDVFPIIDVSESANANKNKKIQLTTILRGIPNGSASAPSVGFIDDTGTTGLFRVTDDEIGISCNQTQIASFATTGLKLGTGTATAQLHLFSTDTTDQVIIENTDAGADTAPDLVLFRNSASPADNDNLANLVFRGQDDNGDAVEYATIAAQIADASNGSEDGILDLMSTAAGTLASRIRLKSEFVGIHEADPTFPLHLSTADTTAGFCIESNLNSSGSSADILLFHRRGDSGAGQDNDVLSTITFQGKNDGANETDTVPAGVEYATIEAVIVDASDDSEDGKLNLQVMQSGSLTTKVAVDSSGISLTGDITISAVSPAIIFTDTNENPDFKLQANGGVFVIYDETNSANRFVVNTDGHIDITGNLDVDGGIDCTGDMTISDVSPAILFSDSNHDPDYRLQANDGEFTIHDETNNVTRLKINTGGIDVTGSVVVSGTVDGVDIAARDSLFGALTSSSGVLTNGVTATTQSASDNSTKVATTAYTDTAISNLVNSAPSTLDTLGEIATALNNDAALNTTLTNSIATKMPLAGGAFTGDVTFTGDSANIVFDKSDNALEFADDAKAIFGASDDLKIYHQSSNNTSYIQNTSDNDLSIINLGTNIYIKSADGEKRATFIKNGAVELYHDNIKRLETASNGAACHGRLTMHGDIVAADNHAIKLGTGLDFTLVHDGTHSVISNNTGNLKLEPKPGEKGIVIVPDGSAELYYDNVKKAETASNGLDVEGTVTCDDILLATSIQHEGQTNTKIAFDGTAINFNSNGVQRLSISQFAAFVQTGYKLAFIASSGENPHIRSFGTNNGDLEIGSGTDSMAQFKRDGAVELYDNGIKRFNTTADAVDVHGHLNLGANTDDKRLRFGINNDLQLYHDATDSHILNSTGILKINSTSGVAITGGLLFGSDTADANKLEDYEEGTWTPNFAGLTASNTTNNCFYIKIGDMVTAWFRATMPTTSSTANATIAGLPFNVFAAGNVGIAGGAFSETNAGSDLSMIGNSNTDNMFILECNSSGVAVKTLAQISGKDFRGSITYRVA